MKRGGQLDVLARGDLHRVTIRCLGFEWLKLRASEQCERGNNTRDALEAQQRAIVGRNRFEQLHCARRTRECVDSNRPACVRARNGVRSSATLPTCDLISLL